MNSHKLTYHVLLLLCFIINVRLSSQDVLMQGWYWDYPKTADGANWSDTLMSRIYELDKAGITHLWLPPLSRASFGNGSNGYDPQDLFDLGEFGGGPTGFASRSQIDALIDSMQILGMKAVADVVYNHRDGGRPEVNVAVEGWIENYNCSKKSSGDNVFPSDRFRLGLPLGGSSGNGAGTYFIKVGSVSGHSDFYNANFRFYCETNTVGNQGLPDLIENEPNGGGGCGSGNAVPLGRSILSWLDNWSVECVDIGCAWEQFDVTINAGDFDPLGDTLWISITNIGGYSDHTVRELYSTVKSGNHVDDIEYFTFTDFTSLPSGRGNMNYSNFKPNGNPTNLGGDWDAMLFFYDYDQSVNTTRDTLIEWTKWLIDDVNIEGLRMDAVKHFDYAFTAALVDSLNMANKLPDLVVGEFFDFDANVLKSWVDNVENSMTTSPKNVRVFDFALRQALENASDQFGYDVRNVFNSGIVDAAGGNADQVMTFVNNHDFRDTLQYIDNDPQLAYCYILTNPRVGIPSIFYPDFFGVDLPNSPDPNLGSELKLLLDIKQDVIDQASVVDYLNPIGTSNSITYNDGFANTTLLYQVKNSLKIQEAIIAINYAGDTLDIVFNWNKLPSTNITLTDRTGKSLTPIVNPDVNGDIRLIIPPRSYAIWTTEDVPSICNVGSVIYVDANAIGDNDGGSWSSAFINLSSALNVAYNCLDVEEVWVKEGTYYPNVLNDRNQGFTIQGGYDLFGGFPANIANPDKNDRMWELHPSILDGDGVYHTLTTSPPFDTMVVDGFVIQGGQADGMGSLGKGAGLFNFGKLKLFNILFNDNAGMEGIDVYNNLNGYIEMNNVRCNSMLGLGVSVLHNEDGELRILSHSRIK